MRRLCGLETEYGIQVDGVDDMDVVVESMDADHAMYRLNPASNLQIGQQLCLIPAQQDAMVSRWDRFVGIRDCKVEAVWYIEARCFHN